MVRPPLHKPENVLSLRHMPTWFLLCASSGLVNAGAYLAVRRFVSHVTGSVTHGGMLWVHPFVMFEYGLVLASFIAGAFLAVLMLGVPRFAKRDIVHALPLLMTAGLVATVGILGHHGLFGPFGGSVEDPADFGFMCVLALAMGAQNAAVATNTGMLVRTTHLTGPATDLGVSLAGVALMSGSARQRAVRESMLRAGKVLAFALGAAAMVPLAARLGHLAFLVPAAVTVVATAVSFVPKLWTEGHSGGSNPMEVSG